MFREVYTYTMFERLARITNGISKEPITVPMIFGAISEIILPIAGILLIIYLIKQLKKK